MIGITNKMKKLLLTLLIICLSLVLKAQIRVEIIDSLNQSYLKLANETNARLIPINIFEFEYSYVLSDYKLFEIRKYLQISTGAGQEFLFVISSSLLDPESLKDTSFDSFNIKTSEMINFSNLYNLTFQDSELVITKGQNKLHVISLNDFNNVEYEIRAFFAGL